MRRGKDSAGEWVVLERAAHSSLALQASGFQASGFWLLASAFWLTHLAVPYPSPNPDSIFEFAQRASESVLDLGLELDQPEGEKPDG